MSIKQVQIKVQDLTLGMYVSGLDRPWSQTPFPLQGFHIRKPKDIESIKSYCSYVYIDVTKGKGPLNAEEGRVSPAGGKTRLALEPVSRSEQRIAKPALEDFKATPIPVRTGVYETVTPVRLEASRAETIIRDLKGNLAVASRQIARGRQVDYRALRNNVDSMVASVLRCPDAFTWLLRLRQKDQFSHDHGLRAALWAVQFARYAGMSREDITILCLGTLLKDIGKMKLSNQILRKRDRSPEEEAEYRQFVNYGVEMLRKTGSIEPRVVSVVHYHCERYDGSGFPEGLAGNKIPLLARIAGIATVYDAISNPRDEEEPVAPSRAVSMLYDTRDRQFQDDLVVKFIQSIGLYPTGTVVELTTGDIGLVLEQHPDSRLTPKVAVMDRGGRNLGEKCLIIDLKEEQESRAELLRSGRDNVKNVEKVAIARDLEPTGYDIDLSGISVRFLSSAVQGAQPGSEKRGLFSGLRERLLG